MKKKSLLTFFKTAKADFGKVLTEAFSEIQKFEPAVNAGISVIDPALTPIVSDVESILNSLEAAGAAPLSASGLQALTTAVATIHSLAPNVLTVNVANSITKVATGVQVAVNAAEAAK